MKINHHARAQPKEPEVEFCVLESQVALVDTHILHIARPQVFIHAIPTRPVEFDLKLQHGTPMLTNVPRTCAIFDPLGYSWGDLSSGSLELAVNILNLYLPPGVGESYLPYSPAFAGAASQAAVALARDFRHEFLMVDSHQMVIRAKRISEWITQRLTAMSPASGVH